MTIATGGINGRVDIRAQNTGPQGVCEGDLLAEVHVEDRVRRSEARGRRTRHPGGAIEGVDLHLAGAGENTWVAGYANDVMAYIPSRRVLLEGGYEGGGAMVYYGLPTVWAPQVEEDIVNEVRRQLTELDPS